MLHKRFGASSEIGEPALADAILDRLVHNSYRMELDGPSLRKTMAAKQIETGTKCDGLDQTSRS